MITEPTKMNDKPDPVEALEPCPWPECSSQPSVQTESSSTEVTYCAQAFVECWDCGARGPKTCGYEGPISDAPKVLAKARAEAIAAWNLRTTEPAGASGVADQLEAALCAPSWPRSLAHVHAAIDALRRPVPAGDDLVEVAAQTFLDNWYDWPEDDPLGWWNALPDDRKLAAVSSMRAALAAIAPRTDAPQESGEVDNSEIERLFWRWWNSDGRGGGEHEAAAFHAGFRAALAQSPATTIPDLDRRGSD